MGSSSQAWEGHAELRQALEGLACAKGTSATRVKAVANAAFKYVKDYKRVVHDVEVFLWKADVEHRLAGLYAIDAIIRQSQLKYGSKDQFTKRFSLHLSNTIAAVKNIPADAQQHVRHVVQEWQSRGFYLATQIEEAGGREYSINNSSSKQTAPPHEQYDQREETTPTASAGKLASLLSIIKKQKELKDQQQESSFSILGDGPPQRHHLPSHQSHNPAPLLPSPRVSEHHLSPQKRASDNGYSHRDAYDNDDRKRGAPLLPEPPAVVTLAPGGRVRRDFDTESNDEWHDPSRAVKKPRGSRWGPPKAANAGDEMRPPPINTLSPRYTGDASRSPTRRPDFQPGPIRATPTGSLHPPGRMDEWPPQQRGPLSSSSSSEPPVGGRVSYGFERDAIHDNNRFVPGAAASAPYGRPPPEVVGMVAPVSHEDRSMTSPHSGHNRDDGGHGDKIPGTSGEICRKFAAGRCTFGDRCWHVHEQHGSKSGRPLPEMLEARRKTVLCKNFPRGSCRFGANCSFAHGEHDLAPPKFRGGNASQDLVAYGDSSGNTSRWSESRQGSPVGGNKIDARAFAPPAHTHAGSLGSANAYDHQHVPPQPPQHQQEQHNRAFGTGMSPHPVLNEVQGDRGNTGASSMSHHPNGPPGVVVGSRPPYQQHPTNVPVTATATSVHDRAPPEAKDTFVGGPPPPGLPVAPPGPSGSFVQASSYGYSGPQPPTGMPPPRLFPGTTAPPPPPSTASRFQPPPPQPLAIKTMPDTSANPIDDDDEAESAAPEFTLQYDDED